MHKQLRAMHLVFAHLSHRTMIVTSGLIEIPLQRWIQKWKKMLFSSYFCQKNTHKIHEIVKVAVINDNNNFAPSIFLSLCEFLGDCFGPRYFSSGGALPHKNTLAQNNHLRFSHNDLKKMVRSYYCLLAKLLFHQSPTRHSDYTVTTTVTM